MWLRLGVYRVGRPSESMLEAYTLLLTRTVLASILVISSSWLRSSQLGARSVVIVDHSHPPLVSRSLGFTGIYHSTPPSPITHTSEQARPRHPLHLVHERHAIGARSRCKVFGGTTTYSRAGLIGRPDLAKGTQPTVRVYERPHFLQENWGCVFGMTLDRAVRTFEFRTFAEPL
jgi:hypothetical protein